MKHRSISIILLFIVSTMLIGIFAVGIDISYSDYYGREVSTTAFIEDQDTSLLIESTEITVFADHTEQTQTNPENEKETLQWWNPGPWYLEYEGIEPLTEEQMLQIRIEWAEEWYDYTYLVCHNQYKKVCSEKDADRFAAQEAQKKYDKNINVLFNEYYYNKFSYVGIVNNCLIILNCAPLTLWDEVVGGRSIQGGRLYVLNDGDFYHLPTAYKNGWLSDEDLTVISDKLNSLSEVNELWKKDVQQRKNENTAFEGEGTCALTES